MRKGDRRCTVFKRRKGVGLPKVACNVSSEDIDQCNLVSNGVGLGSVESEVEVVSASKTKIGNINRKYRIYDDESNNEDNVTMKILSEVLGVEH